MNYHPALGALVMIAVALAAVRHAAWKYLAAASAVFLASMTLRTLDFELCDLTHWGGRATGTHFLWHTLNAVTLYLLLRAAILHGRRAPA